ncbi:hypothetical protein [Halobellus limi]|uniref:Uncharacterized protein n=1 Tax=Halobellus limi TaxID=699433 RepID=A0A1H5SPC4_9EURY|nr:hypothetical protein [Halobellus limi]QCC47531.1 hypothetical protein DV707_07570 [Halobellus limi]SEF52284.1 hypothetical protein SAMN04488133_0032 [Halobellus limi]
MSRELFGVTVAEGTTIRWGAIGTIVFGTPIYIVARGWARGVSLVIGGIDSFVAGLIAWYQTLLSVGLIQATRGWRRAATEFAGSIDVFGISAYAVALAVAALSLGILLVGVTNVFE